MSVLEEINLLAVDVNRDIQSMIFFVRSPPKRDVDERFLELAKSATSNFRALQAKVAEAIQSYPTADMPLMSLELLLEGLQSFLVNTIKTMKVTLAEVAEAASTLSAGPSLEFIPDIAKQMAEIVEKVFDSTKMVGKVIRGEVLSPRIQPKTISKHEMLPDDLETSGPALDLVVSEPSAANINSYLSGSTSQDSSPAVGRRQSNASPNSNSTNLQPAGSNRKASSAKRKNSASFFSLLEDYEKKQKKKERRATSVTAKRKIVVKEPIIVDPSVIETIVTELSELTSIFFNEENNFGKPDYQDESMKEGSTPTVNMPSISTSTSQAVLKASEVALSLQTSSIDLESFLALKNETGLAKLTGVHMRDILSTIKEILESAPNVPFDTLHSLDLAIKDYANTIHDVVNLANPTVEEYADDADDQSEDEDDQEEEHEDEYSWAESSMSKEEETLQALSVFEDALDALDIHQLARSNSKPELHRSGNQNTAAISVQPRKGSWSAQNVSSWSSSSPTSLSNIKSHPKSSSSRPNVGEIPIQQAVALGPSQSNDSPSSNNSRLTLILPSPKAEKPVVEEPKKKKIGLGKQLRQFIQEEFKNRFDNDSAADDDFHFETLDDIIRNTDIEKIIRDPWKQMIAKSKEQKQIEDPNAPPLSNDTDWENSKLKSAFKFMSRKVDSFRKKAVGNSNPRLSGTFSSPQSSPTQTKRMTMSPGSASNSSPVSTPNSALNPSRRTISLVSNASIDPRAYLFEEPDDDSNIRISIETGQVLGGTVEKLIQRLTHDTLPSPEYVLSFLLTHHCFMTSTELMDMLRLRWDTAPPSDTDPEIFASTRLLSIRLRVYNVLRTWVEKYWIDFAADPDLIDRLKLFAATMYHGGLSSAAQSLQKMIQKHTNPEDSQDSNTSMTSEADGPVPPTFDFVKGIDGAYVVPRPADSSLSILRTSFSRISFKLSVLDFHPVEIARQICLIEHQLWKAVKSKELLDVAWTRKDKEIRSPNVLNMIRFSNHITSWMISEIMSQEDLKTRAVVLNRLIFVVQSLMDFRNFNGAMEALSAFHSSGIYRLRSTWNLLPPDSWAIYEAVEHLMSAEANFKTYRSEYEKSVPPYTPYLGTHLSDLLFLEEKLPKYIEGTNLINFSKMEKTAQFIQQLELSQPSSYSFTPVPLIMQYIKEYVPLTEKEAYNKSLLYEARKEKRVVKAAAANPSQTSNATQ